MNATSKIVSAIVIIAVIVVGVWFFSMRGPKYAAPPIPAGNMNPPAQNNSIAPAPSTPAVSETLTVNLSAQNNSGETGTATLTDLGNGKTMVAVKLTGEPQGATQPSHIHMGSCATLGAVKYPLSPIMNGTAETSIDVSLSDLLKQLPLALNAHKSASEINVYTACGDLAAPGSSPTSTTPAAPVSPQPAPTPAPVNNKAPASSGGASTNYGY